MKLSILTATYNRANLLPRLYESILQNCEGDLDFEWLIMDDGSTDHTQELIASWQKENKISIQYYYQENAGKMAAINHLMKYVTGDITFEMDSDDYFLPNVFSKIIQDYENLDPDAYGILYRNDIVGQKTIEQFPFEGEIKKLFDLHYQYNFKFDTALTFRSEARKKFSYELALNERFITEASTYYKMDDQYKGLLIKSDSIMVRDYQLDGYSKNIRDIFKRYPKGYYSFFQYLVNHSKKNVSFKNQFYFMKHYILFSVLNNKSFRESYLGVKKRKERFFFTLLYLPGKWKTNRMFPRKKLLFAAYSLGLGGIETALVSLLNHLDLSAFDITLVLEKKEGPFLEAIDPRIRVQEYRIQTKGNVWIRKIRNRSKLLFWILRNYHHYHFAACYATYSVPGVHLALNGSKNNAIWVHNNYYRLMNDDEKKMSRYLEELKFSKFKKIIFVSEENRNDVLHYCPQYKNQSIVCNNFIDGKKIIMKSREPISMIKEKTTFVNVGRHDEKQKKITRILEAAYQLQKKYDFEVWLIGEGSETNQYKDYVLKHHLENTIKFLGFQKNPYSYMKQADALLLSSEYEGYPVVFIESMILNLPIVSTKVSDYEPLVEKYGIFKDNSSQGVYEGMREFLEKGFVIQEPFDYQIFNANIEKKLKDIIEVEGV